MYHISILFFFQLLKCAMGTKHLLASGGLFQSAKCSLLNFDEYEHFTTAAYETSVPERV